MKELFVTCIVRKETHGGYSSWCPELDVASRGDTVEEAAQNLQEAVQGHIQTAVQENMLDEVMEKLGVTVEDIKNGGHVVLNSFSTTMPMELPV